MSRLAACFEKLRATSDRGFVAYLTAGDPDLATSRDLVLAAARAGADVIEVGVPWSDPSADGPAIQASGFAPSDPLESAILVTLQPGAYTAIVSGVGGGSGVAIVEVFTVP